MAVDADRLKIDPYTSTVPLVQVPPQQAEAESRPAGPLPGNFGKKGTGGLAIGDAIIKGFMQGHQAKEKKQYDIATASINARQGAEQSAWKNYQDGIISGKTPEETKALYDAYTQAHHDTTETMAKYTIPEKPAKTPKGQPKDKKKDGEPNIPQGFGAKLKDFLAANPHIVPQMALLSRNPNPPGLSPENKQAQQEQEREKQIIEQGGVELQNAKDMHAARKTVAMYASLTPEEKAALPTEEKKALAAANSMLYSQTTATKYQVLVDPQGQQHSVPIGTEIPEGWHVYEKPTTANTPRLGTEGEFTAQSLKQYGFTPDNAPPALLKYIHDVYGHRSAQSASTTSSSTVDVHGNRENVNSSTRGSQEPQPPAGFAPIGSGVPQQGGMTSPPKAATPGGMTAAPTPPTPPASTGKGGGRMAAPPTTGQPTLTDANRTMKVENEKSTKYQAAQNKYDKAIAAATTAAAKAQTAGTVFDLEAAKKAALANLTQEQHGIERWYNQQVHAVGGKVPGDDKQADEPPPGATNVYKDKNGVVQGYAVDGQYVAVGKKK